MKILLDNRSDSEMNFEIEELLEQVIKHALSYENWIEEYEISVSFVNNAEIQSINRQFRHIDRPTDVLSFPQLSFFEGETPDKNEESEIILGDIIISVEKAKQQAEEYGHTLEREMAFLTAHSMLHLMGYDHMDEEEEKDMFFRQKEILGLAGYPR